LYFALDTWCARAQLTAAEAAADWVVANGGKRVWYVGHWGFQYYAEHRGMKPTYAGGPRVLAGDFLVLPDQPHNQQAVWLDRTKMVEVHTAVVEDAVPLNTVPNFYGGTAALEHQRGPRMVVRIYRATGGFDPRPLPP
jgi:hypothetical protein